MKKRVISLFLALSVFLNAISFNFSKKTNVMANGIYKDEFSEHYLDFSSIDINNKKDINDVEISRLVVNTQIENTCHSYFFDLGDVVDNIVNNSNKKSNSFFKEGNILNKKALLEEVINSCFDTKSNFNEDLCLLYDLVIVTSKLPDNTMATYDGNNNEIRINEEMLKENKDNTNFLKHVLMHEINHARQHRCNCNKSIYRSIMDLGFKFLLESSAESEIVNTKNILSEEGPTYSEYRLFESNVLLMALFKDKNLEEYYQAIFDSDFKAFYKLFELETKEDYEGFFNILNELNSYSLTEGRNNDVFLKIYKIVCEDIARKVKEDKLSVWRFIFILPIVKTAIINKYTYEDDEFLEKVEVIDDILINYISEVTGENPGEIKDLISALGNNNIHNFYTGYADYLIEEYPILEDIKNNVSDSFYLYVLERGRKHG